MGRSDTIALVRRARDGDRSAREALIARYYRAWLERFHGEMGSAAGAVYSTRDAVQSALLEALRQLGTLRNEGAFFAWVTTIIKHKISRRRARLLQGDARRRGARSDASSHSGRGPADRSDPRARPPVEELSDMEEYGRVTEAILRLFPAYPRPMAAVVQRHLWGKEVEEVRASLGGVSRRSVFQWLKQGLELLRAELSHERPATRRS